MILQETTATLEANVAEHDDEHRSERGIFIVFAILPGSPLPTSCIQLTHWQNERRIYYRWKMERHIPEHLMLIFPLVSKLISCSFAFVFRGA